MKKNNTVILLCLSILICSWTGATQPGLKQADWLIGTWKNTTSRGDMYETWRKISETEWHGKSYILDKKDTVIFESIRLMEEDKLLSYIPLVKGQNDGLSVSFRQKISEGNELLFENKEHDFPQLISYKMITADSLVAEISGTKNGKFQKQIFPMKKMK